MALTTDCCIAVSMSLHHSLPRLLLAVPGLDAQTAHHRPDIWQNRIAMDEYGANLRNRAARQHGVSEVYHIAQLF